MARRAGAGDGAGELSSQPPRASNAKANANEEGGAALPASAPTADGTTSSGDIMRSPVTPGGPGSKGANQARAKGLSLRLRVGGSGSSASPGGAMKASPSDGPLTGIPRNTNADGDYFGRVAQRRNTLTNIGGAMGTPPSTPGPGPGQGTMPIDSPLPTPMTPFPSTPYGLHAAWNGMSDSASGAAGAGGAGAFGSQAALALPPIVNFQAVWYGKQQAESKRAAAVVHLTTGGAGHAGGHAAAGAGAGAGAKRRRRWKV